MRSWWGKSSSKDVRRKPNKGSFIDTISRKLKIFTKEKSSGKSGSSRRRCNENISEKSSQSRVSRSPSPSTPASRCQSFVDRTSSQPLPLPDGHYSYVHLVDSENIASIKSVTSGVSKSSLTLPLPTPRRLPYGSAATGVDEDLPTASVSCDSSSESDDPTDSRLLSPQTSDYKNGSRTALNSPSSLKQKVQSPIASKAGPGEMLKSANLLSNNQAIPTSPKQRLLSSHVPDLQIPQHAAFYSAPDSSMSSPSRSPMRIFGHEPVMNFGFWLGKPHGDIPLLGSGQCSSPGSGQNSGQNSIGGDMSAQPFWPHSRCSPECSPVPSPRMTSPGPGSRIHSGAVTPLHPRSGGASAESSTACPDDGKQQSHRLPLPPISIPHSHFSPFSVAPAISRSPGRIENPPSPASQWKKGRLIGRGTFGHVYLGFNSESGEMCAMKEVTLFSDDAKSRESAQQLGQEISLLSRLRHPNIVQYYGSEAVDDKLYIYLEYVSGGSIYKILQEYGQLGELAIRSYTKQILSGLAFLHAKKTVHRDIKGANILVDPNGRVKLADFGMAKHITGQYCPLSFKGSPYWMAPEVIKNSSGCNLAVDIWSLGCTILEMATTKPPWSQYEGIGNSKELPAMPYHLSGEGKDFVWQCLQRNPFHRPTASQLLEHPFVRSTVPVERPILSPESAEIIAPLIPTVRSVAFGQSPKHMSGKLSPSTISSPRAVSGSTTPLSGGGGAAPLFNPMTYSSEGIGTSPRAQRSFHPNGETSHDLNPDMFRGTSQSHLIQETLPSDNGFVGDNFGGPAQRGVTEQPYQGQSVLANRVAQQLLRDQVKLGPSFDLNPGSPVFGRDNGV
ncbi:PREDICTED: mitogen-activated protein kinase kinase kinase YODA-like isoform X2 [Nicotiana attenuata]|uniref:mitogen-activated protein kinase kinase kinase YODA-like isoform X2 n=1 Tax=Nicotiana attenuata TaxID=49451 RepID=UPI0009055D2B|nr:PREDICTED: mitogen-activated protein kinase kinase kinase YODA-like isoform X2 [Nicotiana attenuata]